MILSTLTARISKQYGQYSPSYPFVDLREIDYIDVYEDWENPDLSKKGNPGK